MLFSLSERISLKEFPISILILIPESSRVRIYIGPKEGDRTIVKLTQGKQ